jgi:hypothetical protein
MKVTKWIASLVVFAALGVFGAVDVVQSFQPVNVRPVALTSVASFGRLVNDVNTAPKSVVSYSAHYNGGKVSCGLAMGRCAAHAAVAQDHALGANVAFRSACARFPTFLSASSSPEDDPKPLDSVWVQLYVDGEKVGRATQVKVDLGSNVDNLATAVKQVYSNKLDGIDVVDLDVYKDADFAKPLRGDEKIDSAFDCGESIDNPIRVTAQTPNQGKLFISVKSMNYRCRYLTIQSSFVSTYQGHPDRLGQGSSNSGTSFCGRSHGC